MLVTFQRTENEVKRWKTRDERKEKRGKFFICNNVMDEEGSWKDTHLFWIEARERETGIWRWIYTVKTKQIYRYSKEFQNAAEVKVSKNKMIENIDWNCLHTNGIKHVCKIERSYFFQRKGFGFIPELLWLFLN